MPLPELSEYQLGYLAGIIDGEGSIQLNRRGVNTKLEGQFQPRVIIFNTDIRLLETLQRWLGGDIGIHGTRVSGRKQVYHIQWLKQSDILELLEKIEPYLIIKTGQAQLLSSWIKLRKTGVQFNDELASAIQRLNSKGGV